MTSSRRGFILATTLLVMTLLTVMLVATFVLISAEFRTTNGSYSTSRSLDLAEAGLQSYFAFAHTLTTGSDSTNYTFPGGYASVVAKRLRDSVPNAERAVLVHLRDQRPHALVREIADGVPEHGLVLAEDGERRRHQ